MSVVNYLNSISSYHRVIVTATYFLQPRLVPIIGFLEPPRTYFLQPQPRLVPIIGFLVCPGTAVQVRLVEMLETESAGQRGRPKGGNMSCYLM